MIRESILEPLQFLWGLSPVFAAILAVFYVLLFTRLMMWIQDGEDTSESTEGYKHHPEDFE